MVDHGLLVLAALTVLGGARTGARGVRLLARGLRRGEDPSAALWVVRGIIVTICMAALAVGTVLGQRWLVVFGALWLAEEIYETGVLALILHAGAPEANGRRPSGG